MEGIPIVDQVVYKCGEPIEDETVLSGLEAPNLTLDVNVRVKGGKISIYFELHSIHFNFRPVFNFYY